MVTQKTRTNINGVQVDTIPGKMLKEIALKSKTAEIAAYALYMRRRLTRDTDIPRLKYDLIKDGHKVINEDFDQLWDDLQRAGMGVLVHGRNGQPNRFEWFYNMRLVAQAALDGKDYPSSEKPNPPDNNTRVARAKVQSKRGIEPKIKVQQISPVMLQRAVPQKDTVQNTSSSKMQKVYVAMPDGDILPLLVPSDASESQIEAMINKLKGMK